MKQHIAKSKECTARIAAAEARKAKIAAEAAKYAAARDAAGHTATELRTKAGRVRAMAAIGEGDDSEAQKLDAEAAAAEAKAANVHATIAGFAEASAAAEASIVAARSERHEAITAALDAHGEAAMADYLSAAQAFIAAHRRLRAIEHVQGSRGVRRVLLTAGECMVPAPVNYSGRKVGPYSDLLYVAGIAMGESATGGPLFDAINTEVDGLEKLGLEV